MSDMIPTTNGLPVSGRTEDKISFLGQTCRICGSTETFTCEKQLTPSLCKTEMFCVGCVTGHSKWRTIWRHR